MSGLREYESGRHAEALAMWSFDFRYHWGAHATGTLRALHAWLTREADDDTKEKRSEST